MNTTATIRRLISERIKTYIQTTIITGHLDVVEWMIGFCLENRIKRVSILPFIPRGTGYIQRAQFELSAGERRNLKGLVTQKRQKLISRIDIRLLDFNARPIQVIEPDGRIVLEGTTEARDVLLFRIPPKL